MYEWIGWVAVVLCAFCFGLGATAGIRYERNRWDEERHLAVMAGIGEYRINRFSGDIQFYFIKYEDK